MSNSNQYQKVPLLYNNQDTDNHTTTMQSTSNMIINNSKGMTSSYGQQIIALIKKTIAVKKRNRTETISEFLIGIYYVVLLIVIKFTIPVPSLVGHTYSPVVNSPLGLPIMYVPDAANQASTMLSLTPLPNGIPLIPFQNETAMVDAYTKSPESYWGGIIFNNINTSTNTIDYTVRMNSSYSNYQSTPYPFIQQFILSSFTSLKMGYNTSELQISMSTNEYPTPANPFNVTTFNVVFPIYFPLFFIYSLQQLIILLVTEKKDGIKEALKVMGMKEGAYWLSNILVQLTMNTLLILMMLILTYPSKVFSFTSPIMVFLQFFIFSLTIIGIAFLVSTFINAPKVASSIATFTIVIGIGLSCLYQFYVIKKVPSLKYLFYLFSPCAFGGFLTTVSFAEGQKITLPWGNQDFYETFGFMVLDFVIYSLMAFYAIQVYPGEFGTGKGWLFFLDRSFWKQSNEIHENILLKSGRSNSINNHSLEGIELIDVVKNYKSTTEKGKSITAVNKLSLSIKSNSIFALLGHNAAGKSTTMGILTGMIPLTTGNAYINGLSVTNQMDFIRSHLGFCPQNNILYNQLTCQEHLLLYGRIKGVPEKQLEYESEQLLEQVDIMDKKDVLSSQLSGGMKRRLCLAMAFIGNPSIVFLDEVTSGLDPFARRKVWDFLQQKKIGRTIIVSTHFMEEAEALGDSIGILHHGALRCNGTALDLKTLFGLGYIISVTFERSKPMIHKPFEDFLLTMFKDAIPGSQNQAMLDKDHGEIELTYSLTSQGTENLTTFFAEIENNQHLYDIKRVGISMTTLEEVFLKIQNEDDNNPNINH